MAFLPGCKIKMLLMEVSFLSLLLLMALVVVLNAKGKPNDQRSLLAERLLGVKHSGTSRKTRNHIIANKKAPFGNKLTYPLLKHLSYRSTVSNPYIKQYTVAYAPSSPQLPPSLYQTSHSSPSPSQYSDTPVSSFQSPYFTSYSNPPALPYSAQASSYPAQLSYFPPSSYPPQAAFPPYSSSIQPNSYISQTQQPSYPSSSSSNPFTYDQTQPISYPVQVSATEYQPQSNPATKPVPTNDGPKKLKPKPSPPDRTEKFEIRGRFFQSIGCWADSPKDRAMATLEGTHTQLKHQDYKTRVNSLMKCAEAADENNLKLFALQNGGQCFGGSNNENTYHKYGRSSECEGDGEGGPWSNEVYSFLDDDGQFLVKPPKENAMDKSNAASTNASRPTCPNPCATNRPSPGFPTVCPSPCNSSIPAQTTGSNSCATPQAINTGGTQICGNPCPPSGSVCNATTSNGNQNQASSGGCGSPCPSPPAPTPGNCTNNGTGTSSCGPSVSAGCINIEGGLPCESQCVTVDSGCLKIPSQPMTSCVSPNPGNSYGGCSGYGSQIIPGSPCVIQGKLIEGCPNGTAGNVTGPSGNGARGSNNTNSAPKCKAKADVGFIIDGSGSIENALEGNYKKVLQFVKNVVKAFEVSKEKTHIGIISYDHDAKVISGFDQHYKKEEIIKEIENMNYPGGGTNTGKALAKAKKELFDKSARAGVPNVAIVLTDGQSNDDVGPPSQELRDSGCSVFSVGMGENFNMAELQQIATDPDSQHVFKAKFEDLDSIADTIVDTVCKGAGGEVKPPPPLLVPTTPSPKPKKIKCKAKVDLAFLLDGSDRIDYEKEGNFKKCQEFIKALVSSYNIGKDGTNVGLVLFYKTSKVVFEFEKYLDVTSLTQAIDTIPYPNKGSNTGIGLDLVKTGLFDVSARQGVRTVLIVITGGSSQDDVQGPSKKLRDMGVTIFCIGLGTEFQRDQLRDMATDPDSKYVITAGYEELNQVLPNFKKICCEASGGTISTTTSSGGRMGIGVGTSGRIGIGIKGSAGGSSSSSSSRIGIGTGRHIGIRIKGSSAGARGGSSSRIIRIKGSRSRGRRIRLKGRLRIRQRMRKIGGRKIILGKISKGSSKSNDNESYIEEEVTENMAKENLFFGGFLGTGVCRDKVDLAFLVDAAGSTDSRGQQNFRTSLEFVKATSSMFSLDQLQSHVGFVVFSNNSPVVLDFDTLFDQKSVENAIDDIEYTGGLADIGTGLNLVKSDLFDSTSRQYVPRVLIAVISGKSTGDVAGPAKALRDAGVTVFCVGVGNNFDLKELDEIATDPDSDHVFTADVTELGLVVKAIKGKVCDGNVRPLALFPLNARYDARDVIGGNPEGQINQVIPSLGPDDVEDGSLAFLGTPDSYIEFPNDGRLDAKYSLTILVWIYPEKEGPIVNFQRDGWGANLWLAQSQKLLAHFVQRDQQQLSEPLQSNKIIPNKWNYVGATYDHTTGRAGLWVNGKFEDSKNLGKFELATNYSIRMGAREGDKRNFRGRISCLQVYNVPLTSEQINNAKDNCKVYE